MEYFGHAPIMRRLHYLVNCPAGRVFPNCKALYLSLLSEACSQARPRPANPACYAPSRSLVQPIAPPYNEFEFSGPECAFLLQGHSAAASFWEILTFERGWESLCLRTSNEPYRIYRRSPGRTSFRTSRISSYPFGQRQKRAQARHRTGRPVGGRSPSLRRFQGRRNRPD